jgi:hypothetical protein
MFCSTCSASKLSAQQRRTLVLPASLALHVSLGAVRRLLLLFFLCVCVCVCVCVCACVFRIMRTLMCSLRSLPAFIH